MALTFGIEEEFVFLDAVTLRPADVAAQVIDRLQADPRWRASTKKEFLAAQIEHASVVFERLDAAAVELLAFRRELARDADRLGVTVAGVGAPPEAEHFPHITDHPRYARVVADMGGVIADHQHDGLHVHIGIPSREHGVVVSNAVRPWLPLLLAMTGNSPRWRGHDTGYASWRTMNLRRWTTADCPPRFVDAADYDRRIHRLLGVGGIADLALIAWNVRLSEHLPTIEFRMADAQLTAGDSLLVAAICRALVSRSIRSFDEGRREDRAETDVSPELLSAAIVHSAKHGLTGTVFDPYSEGLAPADVALSHLLRHIETDLDAAGDRDAVIQGLERLLAEGTGAARQRAAYAAGGPEGLRRLYADSLVADPLNRKFDAVEASAFLG